MVAPGGQRVVETLGSPPDPRLDAPATSRLVRNGGIGAEVLLEFGGPPHCPDPTSIRARRSSGLTEPDRAIRTDAQSAPGMPALEERRLDHATRHRGRGGFPRLRPARPDRQA